MRCSKYKKITLLLIHTTRKLKPYFEEWLIKEYIEYPLNKILANTPETNRLANWETTLVLIALSSSDDYLKWDISWLLY